MLTGKIGALPGSGVFNKIGRLGVKIAASVIQPVAPLKSARICSYFGLPNNTIKQLNMIIAQADEIKKPLASMALGNALFYNGIKTKNTELIKRAQTEFVELYTYQRVGQDMEIEARFNDAVCSCYLKDTEYAKKALKGIVDIVDSKENESCGFNFIEKREIAGVYLNKILYDHGQGKGDFLGHPIAKTFGTIKNLYLFGVARKQFYKFISDVIALDYKEALAKGKIEFDLPDDLPVDIEKHQCIDIKGMKRADIVGYLVAKYDEAYQQPFFALAVAEKILSKNRTMPVTMESIYGQLHMYKDQIKAALAWLESKNADKNVLVSIALNYYKLGLKEKAFQYFEAAGNTKELDEFYRLGAKFNAVCIAVDLVRQGIELMPRQEIIRNAEEVLRDVMQGIIGDMGKKMSDYKDMTPIQLYEALEKDEQMPKEFILPALSIGRLYEFLKDIEKKRSEQQE